MTVRKHRPWLRRLAATAIVATGLGALTLPSAPAEARVFVGIGVGVPGIWGGYYAPPPYYRPYPAYYGYAYPYYGYRYPYRAGWYFGHPFYHHYWRHHNWHRRWR